MKNATSLSALNLLAYFLTGPVILAMLVLPGVTAFSSGAHAKAIAPHTGPFTIAQPLGPPPPMSSIYNSIPNPLPPNVPSLGYQAAQTAEFGDLIQFSGTTRKLAQVTVVMSDWAVASDYPSLTGPTWSHPITLNLYNVDNSGAHPAPGTLIASKTQTFAIPWRPGQPTCQDGTWKAPDGTCHGGIAFTITFDFSGTTVPDQIIYGVAFNTETYGYNPIGSPGPYISLNVGLAQAPPTVGSEPFADTAYWNTIAGNYTDGGTAGANVFRRDTAWTPYSVGADFQTLEPLGTCLKDDHTGDFIQWNTTTGDYTFTHCGKNGFTLTGTGKVGAVNGVQTLKDSKADRNISAGFNNGQSTGSANVIVLPAPGISTTYRINDTNPHATCTCGVSM